MLGKLGNFRGRLLGRLGGVKTGIDKLLQVGKMKEENVKNERIPIRSQGFGAKRLDYNSQILN